MPVYELLPQEFQKLNALVSKVSKNEFGLNQLFDPDEIDTKESRHAEKIQEILDNLKQTIEGSELNDNVLTIINEEVINFYHEVRNIERTNSGPETENTKILNQIVKTGKKIIDEVIENPAYQIGVRVHQFNQCCKEYNSDAHAMKTLDNIKFEIKKTIDDLEIIAKSVSPSHPRKSSLVQIRNFFSGSKSNKIMDSSQIPKPQRVTPQELKEIIPFLRKLLKTANEYGNDPAIIDISMKYLSVSMKECLDSMPNNSSAILINILSVLNAKITDANIALKAENTTDANAIKEVLTEFIEFHYREFMNSTLGKFYQYSQDVGIDNVGEFLEDFKLKPEELNRIKFFEYAENEKLQTLLVLVPEEQFDDLMLDLRNSFESKLSLERDNDSTISYRMKK